MMLTKPRLVIALALVTAMTTATSIVSGRSVQGRQSSVSSNSERTIVGVWRTLVTPRNCQTGEPLAPAFPGLFTFNRGSFWESRGPASLVQVQQSLHQRPLR
jgi:hypothetical protein